MQNRDTSKPRVKKKRPPIENLVLEGAGVKGGCYAGAFKVLEERNVLKGVKRVGGSSAGAIGALLLAVGNSAGEIGNKLAEMDFTTLLDERNPEEKHKEGLIGGSKFSMALAAKKSPLKGVFKGDAFVEWAKNEIRTALAREPGFQEWLTAFRHAGQPVDLSEITYSELHHYIDEHPGCRFKDLYVTATDITEDKSVVLSHQKTPNAPLWLGVRMSMSFPTAFEAVKCDLFNTGEEHLYVDGGLANNYPINIFNEPQFVPAGAEGLFRRHGTNLGTLGIKIDSIDECARLLWNIQSYSDMEDLTTRVAEHSTRIRVVDRKPKLNEYHRNELCIYDISPVTIMVKNENNEEVPREVNRIRYVVKHLAKDKDGKEKVQEVEGEILEGEGPGQLSRKYMHFYTANKGNFPEVFHINGEGFSQGSKDAIKALLDITTERRHTAQKKIAEVKSSGNKGERLSVRLFYSKKITSQKKGDVEEEKIRKFHGYQTIQIYDAGVKTLQFGLTQKEKDAMFASGERATASFIDNYMDEPLPDIMIPETIQKEITDKTVEELVELMEEYNVYLSEGYEAGFDAAKIDEYIMERDFLRKLVCYKLITELDHVLNDEIGYLDKTSIFKLSPIQFTENRFRLMEGTRNVVDYQVNTEKDQLELHKQKYEAFLMANHEVLSKFAVVPPMNTEGFFKKPADAWIFNPDELKTKHSKIYNEWMKLHSEGAAIQKQVDVLTAVLKKIEKRIDDVLLYRSSHVRTPVRMFQPAASSGEEKKEVQKEKRQEVKQEGEGVDALKVHLPTARPSHK